VKRPSRNLVAPALLLLAACVGQRDADADPGPHDRNLLTAGELANYSTAEQAVRTLRPAWLRQRSAGGFQSAGQVWVYRDGMRFGGVEVLSRVNTIEVDSIRYVDGITATQRWGLGHENGVIHIFSRTH
jgi:hypothetical protein